MAISYSLNDEFSNNIKILNKNELQNILFNDPDNYYNKFTKLDLSVRNVNSVSEYKNKIMSSPVDIDFNLKSIINDTCSLIDTIFKKYNTNFFDGNKASEISWTIGIIDDLKYEAGLPHTRNNIIIIPKHIITTPKLFTTLIHEKIHVYQKLYLKDIDNFLNKYKFKKINYINRKYIRANPDINDETYVDENNKVFICQYNPNPKNISDVTVYPINEDKYEHPYEYMAYMLTNEISKIT